MKLFRGTFPLPPNRANARGASRFKNHEKKRYVNGTRDGLVGAASLAKMWAREFEADELPIDPAVGHAVIYTYNRFDDDNAAALLKWVLDSLVRAGIIADDGRPAFRMLFTPDQVIDRKCNRASK